MTIFGIDFTSVPSSRKPITCVRTRFDGDALWFEELHRFHDFKAFEALLATPGRWVAGVDFPIGQARRLVENIGWPRNWAGYVHAVGRLERSEFRATLEDYKRDRPHGDKHHKRLCDRLTRSQSPQTLYGTPVALMFYEGAPRLLEAGVHLPHHHDGDNTRVVLEAYPGVAARQLIGDAGYKNDNKKKQTAEQRAARQGLLKALQSNRCQQLYGFAIDAPGGLANDPGADDLDAFICAVQAAWGFRHAEHGFGAPDDLDRLEGWISDPSLRTGCGPRRSAADPR